MKHTERILVGIVCAVLALIFLYLSGYALLYTSYISDKGYLSEPIHERADVIWQGLLFLLGGLLLLWLFGKAERFIPSKLMVGLTLFGVLAAGVFWVCAAQTTPRADAGYIATAARRIMSNNYAELKRAGGYFNQHPYQVGFLMISELLQRLFGPENYLPMQIFNVLCLTAAYGAVLRLSWLLSHDGRVLRFTALFLILCLQPVLYCTFLYGNILSITCVLWAAVLMLGVVQGGSLWLFLPVGLLCGFSVLFKPNGWLPVLALCILSGLWLLSEKKWRVLPLLCALVLGPMLITGGVKAVYAARAHADLSKGVPMTAYLAMGLQESSRAPGWYNEYVDRVYRSADYDPARASKKALRNISMRLADFADDPAYTADFFHQKMVSQWNETTFEAIWINKTCPYAKTRLPFAKEVLNGSLRQPLEDYMEWYTILLYVCFTAGLALLCRQLFCLKKPMSRSGGFGLGFLAVTVFGAFLYHMIFEAKSQYLFTYLLCMIPVAAWGAAALSRVQRKAPALPEGADMPQTEQ